MAPPKPSTAASNTYAAPPSDSETSPTTSPEHSSKQEDSDPNYTLNYEEPDIVKLVISVIDRMMRLGNGVDESRMSPGLYRCMMRE